SAALAPNSVLLPARRRGRRRLQRYSRLCSLVVPPMGFRVVCTGVSLREREKNSLRYMRFFGSYERMVYVTRLCRSTQLTVLEEGKRDVQVLRLLTFSKGWVPKNRSKLAKNL